MRGLTEVFDGLVDEFAELCKKEGLHFIIKEGAYEALHNPQLTSRQRECILNFIENYELAEDDERSFFEGE